MDSINSFLNTAMVTGNEYDPDLNNNTASILTEIYTRHSEFDCIIIQKIFSSCKCRQCFLDLQFELPYCNLSLIDIRFGRGQLTNQEVIPLVDQENYARVIIDLRIPITFILKRIDGKLLTLQYDLPALHKDIILYYPPTPSEIDFILHVETRSEQLIQPVIDGEHLVITIGSIIKVFLAIPVQLQIWAMGYCPEPAYCQDYLPSDPCEQFLDPITTTFPESLYPPN